MKIVYKPIIKAAIGTWTNAFFKIRLNGKRITIKGIYTTIFLKSNL